HPHPGGRPGASTAVTPQVQPGILDPVIGRSYAEIAAEGRSQHKSQEMGTIEPLGPSVSGLRLIESLAPPLAQGQSVFDGLDVSLSGLGGLAQLPSGALRAEIQAMTEAATLALSRYA